MYKREKRFTLYFIARRGLVGCFFFFGGGGGGGLNGPLRQYFSLYRAVSQREGERYGGNYHDNL